MRLSTLFFGTLISILCSNHALRAQTEEGILRGIVMEASTGEPLFSANIQVVGVQAGAVSDFDGNFELRLPEGSYDLSISFLGLQTLNISSVQVMAGEVELLGKIRLKPGGEELEEVTVTAEAIKNTESALIAMRAKSANVMDGISAQTFKKIGDGNAAAAVKRVPGVSLQGGKYVYVRGLGDRYTKTTLHGMDIPGLDPDRNSLQMDIFPTNIISNIIVRKSFTADLPADFTGGVVNIETKEFPEKPVTNVSASIGFTPGMHFNSAYRSYEGGGLDFLGFDDGSRSDPLGMSASNPAPTGEQADPRLKPSDPGADGFTRSFNEEMGSKTSMSPLNFGLGISGGNQLKWKKRTLGWIASFSYKNKTNFYENWEQNYYRKDRDSNTNALRSDRLQSGALGINNVFVSGLLGGALKTTRSKYKIVLMHLQNGESKAGLLDQDDFIRSNNEQVRHNLEYSQRSISNALISGKHLFDGGDWELDWRISPTYSQILDKDIRLTNYLVERDANESITSYAIDASEGGFPKRLWRSLNEYNIASRVDAHRTHDLFGKEARLTFGVGYVIKNRDYSILDYELRTLGNLQGLSGNGDELMTDAFLWNAQDPNAPGVFVHGQFQANNTFNGVQQTLSAYASESFRIGDQLRGEMGIRMEKYDQSYTGQNQIANETPNAPNARIFDNEKVLDILQFFPSVNLIYALSDRTNLRASWSQTTARPSFREISTAEIVDVLSGMTFIGNVDLVQTDIQNMDLRYETFFNGNQMLSLSGFYKTFVNPIEMISYEQDPSSFQPRNVGDARLFGLELEGRFNMSELSEKMEAWSLNSNLTLIDAQVAFDKRPGGDYDGKINGLRVGEEPSDYRDMQGQSPYIVNVGLSYRGLENGYEAGLFYNVQGPKLVSVGINYTPDVYSVPFHGLNFNFRKVFGEDGKYQLGLSLDNILDDVLETETRSFRADANVFNRLSPGRTFGLNFSLRI